jgi:CRP/FNR family transcriptional regulator, cyclic AMP receptor protein
MQSTLTVKGIAPIPFFPFPMTKPAPAQITLDPAFLQRHALFSGLTEEDLKDLPVLFRVEQYQRGERIITEGERGGTLYVIYRGGVDIHKQVISREGECQQKIATLHQGDTFGEMELIDHQPRSATVIAQPDTVVLALDNIDLRKLNLNNTRVYATMLLNLAREISRRLRATDQYLAVSLFSIREQSRFRLFPKE